MGMRLAHGKVPVEVVPYMEFHLVIGLKSLDMYVEVYLNPKSRRL
jgi:hypothetical protein